MWDATSVSLEGELKRGREREGSLSFLKGFAVARFGVKREGQGAYL